MKGECYDQVVKKALRAVVQFRGSSVTKVTNN